jgi:hypothetical protein
MALSAIKMSIKKNRRQSRIGATTRHLPGVLGAIILGTSIKLILVFSNSVPFNSDEAVVGLMAKHILQGNWLTFFYGQPYMGSLDAYLVAAAFSLLGDDVWVIRIVQIILYAVFMATLWIFVYQFTKDAKTALIATWLASIPPVLLTTYTTPSLGGYGELLVLGNLVLILGHKAILDGNSRSSKIWFLLGLVAGLAFWTSALAVVYFIPLFAIGIWIWKNLKVNHSVYLVAGFLIGSSPWWLYNIQNSGEALFYLLGKSEQSPLSTNPLHRLVGFFLLGLPALLGFRHPWSPEFSPWPVTFVSILFYLIFGVYLYHHRRSEQLLSASGGFFVMGLFSLGFLIIFLGSNFGIDATGRYLLPLYVPLFMFLSFFIRSVIDQRVLFGIGILVIILSINSYETFRGAISEDRITTQFDPITRFDNSHDQELLKFLYDQVETRGYTNYWVSYRLAFLSNEEIIFSPRLPYKADLSYNAFDNRIPTYEEIVLDSARVAYITTLNPLLDEQLRGTFSDLGVDWQEAIIGHYRVFYDISDVVLPQEIGLYSLEE